MNNWAVWEEEDVAHLHRFGMSFVCGATAPEGVKLIWDKRTLERLPCCPECSENSHLVQVPKPPRKPQEKKVSMRNLTSRETARWVKEKLAACKAGLPTPKFVRDPRVEKCPYCPKKITYVKKMGSSVYTAHDVKNFKALGEHNCNGSGAENDARVGLSGGGFETNRRRH
jgi:hypothetical protein